MHNLWFRKLGLEVASSEVIVNDHTEPLRNWKFKSAQFKILPLSKKSL